MNTKKKKNRIILCICSILVLFASIFAVIPFNNDTKVVKADTVISSGFEFIGSPLVCAFTPTNVASGFVDYDLPIYATPVYYSFSSDSSNHLLSYSFNLSLVYSGLNSYATLEVNDIFSNYSTYDDSSIYQFYYNNLMSDGTNNYYAVFQIVASTVSFSNNKPIVTMGEPISFDYACNLEHGSVCTIIKYFDKFDNFLSFRLYYSRTSSTTIATTVPFRTYFLTTDLSDSEIYNQGFRDGEDKGYIDGLNNNVKYNEGYTAGKNDGYSLGYNTALENNNVYTFSNLISSVIDVPVKTFTSLFNFEILGVNLSGFFLGLLTCCIVIGVVRLIL